MKLVLNVVSNSPWRVLAPTLMSLGWDEREMASGQASEAGMSLDSVPSDGEFYLLLQWHPEKVVAQAMRQGMEPQEALRVWKIEAERQISFHEGNPGSSLLIDIDCLLEQPEEVLKNFPEELNVTVIHKVPQSAISQSCSDLYQLLASRAISQSPEVLVLLERLYSGFSVKSGKWCITPDQDISQLYNELTSLSQAGRESDAALEVVRQENQLLLAQLRRAENELDNLYRKVAASNRKLKESAGAGLRGLYRRLRRILAKFVNPSNPIIWRITTPVRALTRPMRKGLS